MYKVLPLVTNVQFCPQNQIKKFLQIAQKHAVSFALKINMCKHAWRTCNIFHVQYMYAHYINVLQVYMA